LQRFANEREAFEAAATSKLRKEFEGREAQLRADLVKARDEQVRVVITKLDSEFEQERKNAMIERDKHVSELKQVIAVPPAQSCRWRYCCANCGIIVWLIDLQAHEANVKQIAEELEELRTRLSASSVTAEARTDAHKDEIVRLSQQQAQHYQELAAKSELIAKLEHQLQVAQTAVDSERKALTNEMNSLHNKIAQLEASVAEQQRSTQNEIAALQATHKAELLQQRKQKAAELEEVETRLKSAFKKRDDTIAALQSQLDEEKIKAETAKKMMIQQRRDLLGESMTFEEHQHDHSE
jgi:DNA repair exonuclease SbcCD ATPase subunit